MPDKTLSSPTKNKSLSTWDQAIIEGEKRIREMRRSITRFKALKAQGMKFPEPKGSGKRKRATKRTSASTL